MMTIADFIWREGLDLSHPRRLGGWHLLEEEGSRQWTTHMTATSVGMKISMTTTADELSILRALNLRSVPEVRRRADK